MKILSFGEILWDVYPNKKYIGGAPLNFAAHCALCGEDVYMLSAVGDDELGKNALTQIKQWGIKTDFIFSLPHKETGKCMVTLNNAVPCYNLLQDVAYDYIPVQSINEEFDVLYFGTLSLRSEYNLNSLKNLLKNKFKEIVVDINIRKPFYNAETVGFALKNATIIKISLEEMPVVADLLGINEKTDYAVFARELQKTYSNLRCVLITLGELGALVLNCDSKQDCFCPAAEATVVSAVGAGDSFSAAFLHKYLRGEDMADCLEFASKIAAFVVGNYAAVPEYNVNDFE